MTMLFVVPYRLLNEELQGECSTDELTDGTEKAEDTPQVIELKQKVLQLECLMKGRTQFSIIRTNKAAVSFY